MEKFDLAIIGSGPGGYVAALYAAQKGIKTCLIESDKLGGVCLNEGCIPTKALIKVARTMTDIKEAGKIGIICEKTSVDFKATLKSVKDTVSKLTQGVDFLLKKRGVKFIKGRAFISDKTKIRVGNDIIETKYIIIAAGSSSVNLPFASADGKDILSNSGILDMESIPKKLIIIGGGFIGCEYASMFRQFGAEVAIIEMMDRLIPSSDEELSRKLAIGLKGLEINVLTNEKVTRVTKENNTICVELSDHNKLECDKLIIAVGRKPNVEGYGLNECGIKYDNKGIKVDDRMATSVSNIYAIGDCAGGLMLAHAASRQAKIAVDAISGKDGEKGKIIIPYAVFTDPEAASCGITESQAKEQQIEYGVSKFIFKALGKAHTVLKTEGFVKLIYDKSSKILLGAHIMGYCASELINEACLAITNKLTINDIVKTIHVHPTMSEAILEAAEAADGHPIHGI